MNVPFIMIRARICYLLFALGSLHASNHGIAFGDEATIDDKPYAMMTVEEADADFQFQGEFVGNAVIDKIQHTLGLQVVALGNGSFSAMQYVGGLPGGGWNGEPPTKMSGTRTKDLLVLSGGKLALLSKRDQCLIIDDEGRRVGRLRRIKRVSPTLGAKPSKGAMVLFNGENTDHFTLGEMTENGLLKQGADLKPMFQDFNLHLEFQLSYMPKNEGQQRSNSGVYLQSRYEVQVLDSFGLDPLINGCGSLYWYRAPDLNMCLPPLSWQTYDIVFTSPRFASDGSKTRDAQISVWLNGVRVQDKVKLANKTGAGKPEAPTLLPIRLQNHKDEVRYRNIWIVDRGLNAPGRFPVIQSKPDSPTPKKKNKRAVRSPRSAESIPNKSSSK